YAMKLREAALLQIEPRVIVPTTNRTFSVGGRYPWKEDIVTTIFWVGESASTNNPVHNRSSSWDADWSVNFGGYDDPNRRNGWLPVNVVPRQNPFYVALPYNDVTYGTTKPEARQVIPWFRQVFEREGKSVCRDRWVAIKRGNKVCYAQWSDCGPFRTDHWQYVFGNERPKPNLNRGAGLDVSPAVRDYLGMAGTDVTAWRFVEFRDVPNGPWANWGDNNHFVILGRQQAGQVASAAKPRAAKPASAGKSPGPGKSVSAAKPPAGSEAPKVLTR
ncbi:MAG: hypothetical protein M3463_23615, partial [Verrucomicrobiota bacterium]|nr:hypothetical protein [Verrucomicrobiota bacterium]